jgi:hypothetical protein
MLRCLCKKKAGQEKGKCLTRITFATTAEHRLSELPMKPNHRNQGMHLLKKHHCWTFQIKCLKMLIYN